MSGIRRRITAREECVRDHLRRLPPCCIVIGTEVRQIAGRHARLSHSTTWIARHDRAAAQAVSVGVVCASHRHILKLPAAGRVREAGGVRDYLADLPPRCVRVGAELGQVSGRHAGLAYPAARIAADVPTGG